LYHFFTFKEGNASKSGGTLVWTEPPLALAHDTPYLIGLMKKTVEIRCRNFFSMSQTVVKIN